MEAGPYRELVVLHEEVITKAAYSDRQVVQDALDAVEPRLRRTYLLVLEHVRDQRTLGEWVKMVQRGDFEDVIRDLERAAAALTAEITAAYAAAGRAVTKLLARYAKKPDKLIRFDVTNMRAVAEMRAATLERVREVTEAARATFRQVLVRGVEEGINPRVMATRMRDSLGLTKFQERAVDNYRKLLQAGDADALRRELRDRRFDSSTGANLTSDAARADFFDRPTPRRPLTAAQVDRMVGRYRTRFVAYRAEVIARTEALAAVNAGTEEAYRQAAELGVLDLKDLERTWHAGNPPRTRDSHHAMRGQKRLFGKHFTSGAGYPLRYPGDPQAPGKERIQCRCVVSTRFRSEE